MIALVTLNNGYVGGNVNMRTPMNRVPSTGHEELGFSGHASFGTCFPTAFHDQDNACNIERNT